jgi:pimeloyl-ACP methyl ester carboxylesterase
MRIAIRKGLTTPALIVNGAFLRTSAVTLRIPSSPVPAAQSKQRDCLRKEQTHHDHFPRYNLSHPVPRHRRPGRAFVSRITARIDDRDAPVSDQTIAAYRAAARGWASAPADNFGYLDGIAQPALVVNGSNDIVIPTINSYHLYQHLPDAELILLPDSGHGAHFQYVERFVRRVIDFLDVQPHDTGAPA